MAKEEKLPEELKDPFGGFSIIKGEFSIKDTDTQEDEEIETGDPAEIKDDLVEDTKETEEDKLKRGDKALQKVIDAKIKASEKKKKEEAGEDAEETVEETEETAEDTEDSNDDIKSFVKALSEKGVIDFDDTDEDFKGDEESIEVLINKTVNNRINKWAKGLPEEFSSMLQFIENGGNPKDFLDVYYGNHSWEEFKLDHEDNQKIAYKEHLRLMGESEEDIQEIVDEAEVNGTLEKRASKALDKLKKHEAEQKAELIEQQRELAERQRLANEEYWNNFKKSIQEKEDLKGFKLTNKLKDNLWEFLTVRDKKTGKTGYEQAIANDTDSQLMFAYLAMNKFDISKLERQVETKVARNYSGMLKNYSKTSKEKISSGSTREIGNDNPFAGFKK